jgi:predicted HicB family RNase H-like nuclease
MHVRVPGDVHAALVSRAARMGVSVNALVVLTLSGAVAP